MEPINQNVPTSPYPKIVSKWVENTEITLKNFPLRVGQKIKEGLTANVFEGNYRDCDVVIKVMKIDTGVDIRSYFVSEGENISEIRRLWNDYWPNEDPLVPQLFVDENTGVEPYLIMEMIHGNDFEKLVEGGHKVEEVDGVALGTQIGKLLCVLHEGLKKTYADIKFDNFWMTSDRDANSLPVLRVIDWNILAEYEASKARRDLFYVTAYLFNILTGVPLEIRGIQSRTRLQKVEAFRNLTIGVQQFFQRALHPDMSHRFENAREWLAQLTNLKDWWQQNAMALNIVAGKELDEAQKNQAAEKYEDALKSFSRARAALEISDRKGRGNRQVWQTFADRIKVGLVSTSDIETGLNFLRSWQFEEAQTRFRRGADLSMDETDREIMLRWYWLATAGLTMGREAFKVFEQSTADGSNELINAVQSLVNGEALKAEEVLKRACNRLNPVTPAVAALRDEAHVINLVNRAQSAEVMGNFDQIAALYEEAYRLADTLPQSPRTAWGFGLNLFDLWQAALTDASTIGEAQKILAKASQAVAEKNYDQASLYFVAAQQAAEDYQETVKVWEKAVADALREGNIMDVLALTKAAFGLGGAKDVLVYWRAGQEIRKISLLVDDNQLENAIGKIEQFSAAHPGSPEMLGSVYQAAIRKASDLATSKLDNNALQRMLVTAVSYNLGVQEYIKNKIKELSGLIGQQRRTRILEFHQQILDQLQKGPEEGLAQAEKLCGELRLFLTPEELPEWQNLFDQVHTRFEEFQANANQRKAASAKRLGEIGIALEKVDKNIEKGRVLIESLDLNDRDERSLYDRKAEARILLAQDGLVLVGEWQHILPGDHEQDARRQAYIKILENTGFEALSNLQQLVMQRLNSVNQWVEKAKTYYEQGNINACLDQIETIESTNGNAAGTGPLKEKAYKAKNFVRWMDGFKNKLETMTVKEVCSDNDLKEWLKRGLLPVYWQVNGNPLFTWTETQLSDQNLDAFLRLSKVENAYVPGKLVDLIMASRLHRALLTARGDQTTPAPSKSSSLDGFIRYIIDLFALPVGHRLNQQAALLQKIEDFSPTQSVSPAGLGELLRKQKQDKSRKRMLLILGPLSVIVLVCLLVVFVTGIGTFGPLGKLIMNKATPTAQPPETAFVEVTVIVTATPLPAPTKVATSIPVPPGKLVATTAAPEQPTSQYAYKTDVPIPPLPAGVTPLYLIDANDQTFTKPGWTKSTNPTDGSVGGLLYSVTSPVDSLAVFAMDIPVGKAGMYEVFYSDALKNCGQVEPIDFQVKLKAASDPLIPVMGTNIVALKLKDAQPKGTEWASLGVYQLSASDQVEVVVDPKTNVKTGILCADAVLIGSVASSPAEKDIPVLAAKPKGDLVLWSDERDPSTVFVPKDGWTQEDAHDTSWLGDTSIKYSPADASNPTTPPQVTWTLSHALYAGVYNVYTIIPTSFQGTADFEILLDAAPVAGPGPVDSTKLPDSRYVLLATVTITDTSKPNILSVTVKPDAVSQTGVLAVDAILVFKAPPPAK